MTNVPASRPLQIKVYTKDGCHLCDQAIEVVRDFVQDVELVDISTNPELQEKFCKCIPVVEINGKIRFRTKIDRLLLKRILLAESNWDAKVD